MAIIRIRNTLGVLRAARYRTPQSYRTFTTTPQVLAVQGYGDGKGSPSAENPQEQPPASRAQESSEHPGPPPPDVGKGTGGGPTKAAFRENMEKAASPEDASAESGGSRSKEAKETGSSPTGGDVPNAAEAASRSGGEALKGPQGKGAPQPKIHNQAIPGAKEGLTEEQKAEVERHNRDFEKKHDRGAPAPEDKVDKKFWKGTGGKIGSEPGSGKTGTEVDWNA